MSDQSSLAAALAKVQADLPQIVKGETARVPTKDGGSYSYTYADLASISEAVLPLLAEHGLSFVAKPTVMDTGAFVLAYSLLHVSGEREDGSYPLPNSTPQAVGSAITYARRYVLCAVTGVAPEDDDGQAAQQAATSAPASARPAAQPEPSGNGSRVCAVCGDDLAGASVAKTDKGYVHRDKCAAEVGV